MLIFLIILKFLVTSSSHLTVKYLPNATYQIYYYVINKINSTLITSSPLFLLTGAALLGVGRLRRRRRMFPLFLRTCVFIVLLPNFPLIILLCFCFQITPVFSWARTTFVSSYYRSLFK